MTDVQVPVLIAGGGGAGLTASMLLSQLGVESLLVSALPTTSILPKAHVLNQRAMEILREAGVADRVYAKSTPAEQMQATAWYAGSPTALPSLLAFAKPGHVLFGSDWPHAPAPAVSYFTGQLDAYAALDAAGHAAIDRENARALFQENH